MKIAILGTGRVGCTLATIWAKLGHDIMLGSREAARGQQVAAGLNHPQISGGNLISACEHGDVILFAFPWYALTDIARAVGKLQGKIIIDCINPMTSSGSLALGHKRSAGEEIGKEFPLAKPIKAFNHIYLDHFADPMFSGQAANAFYCSNFDDAKAAVIQLATEMGFEPLDLGPLKQARYLEPFAVMWIHMAFYIGMGPEFTLKMVPR